MAGLLYGFDKLSKVAKPTSSTKSKSTKPKEVSREVDIDMRGINFEEMADATGLKPAELKNVVRGPHIKPDYASIEKITSTKEAVSALRRCKSHYRSLLLLERAIDLVTNFDEIMMIGDLNPFSGNIESKYNYGVPISEKFEQTYRRYYEEYVGNATLEELEDLCGLGDYNTHLLLHIRQKRMLELIDNFETAVRILDHESWGIDESYFFNPFLIRLIEIARPEQVLVLLNSPQMFQKEKNLTTPALELAVRKILPLFKNP